jgi:GAF domain-containing protein
MSTSSKHAAGAKPAKQNTGDLQRTFDDCSGPQRACHKLAQLMQVQRNEVALFRLEKNSLRFLFPIELRAAGAIPLSGSAVAARTAATRAPLLSNNFARVKHVSLFESIKLSTSEDNQGNEQLPIQRIISVPVIDGKNNVVGVVQVSRKGLDSSLAGSDFTSEDLKQLELAAGIIGCMPFMQDGAPLLDDQK